MNMTVKTNLDLQIATDFSPCPEPAFFDALVAHLFTCAALNFTRPSASLTIRLVGQPEIQTLNATYRQKDKPTNVLSFPFEAPPIPDFDSDFLGDIVICLPVISAEATKQHKSFEAHLSHITVHGVLHLLGFDHIDETDAVEMESLEKTILASINISDPYEDKTA